MVMGDRSLLELAMVPRFPFRRRASDGSPAEPAQTVPSNVDWSDLRYVAALACLPRVLRGNPYAVR